MLPDCLKSVEGFVDEIIVVDTGSQDKTMSLARKAGARVVEQPWMDDFSAPRNRGLAEATGEWVLVLDADERLTRAACKALREAVALGDFDCGMLPLHNASRADAKLEDVVSGKLRLGEVAYLPRLLRRTPDLEYHGIIHESVGQWLVREDRQAKFLAGIDIVHLGGVPDIRQRRDKSKRNIALLERYRERSPDDVTPYGYLAHEYLEAGNPKKAREVADEGWARLRPGRALIDLSVLRLATARAWLLVQGSEPVEALSTLATGLQLVPDHPDLHFIRGCALEMQGLCADSQNARNDALASALDVYEVARSKDDKLLVQKFVQGCTSWAAEVRLGTMRMLLGHPAEAIEHFDRAVAQKEDCVEAHWGRIECRLAMGDVVTAVREVQAVNEDTDHVVSDDGDDVLSPSDRPDGWVLAALGAEAAGMLDNMGTFVKKAQECLPAGFIAPHRRERYHDALAALSMYRGTPAAIPGPLGQLAGIMRGGSEEVAGARTRPLDLGVVQRIVRHLLLAGKTEYVLPLVEPRAEALLPGLAAEVSAVVQQMS